MYYFKSLQIKASSVQVQYHVKKNKKQRVGVQTRVTASLISVSTQSLIMIGAVSGSPPRMTCVMAGLSPGKRGPAWRKRWPIILPAATNRSLSARSTLVHGVRWSSSPSNSSIFAREQQQKVSVTLFFFFLQFHTCLMLILNPTYYYIKEST